MSLNSHVHVVYLFAVCLAPQVSVQFVGNRVASHTGEHANAGILHLE